MLRSDPKFLKSFPEYVRFQRKWRTYQARVLSELEEHLDDDHLHVVAAPGSGKTVLGLEIVRHLNQPSLILSPTIAIREQWIDRFLQHFCPSGESHPEWISKDIKNPKFMTVTTYQALHSAFAGQNDAEEEERPEETQEKPEQEDETAKNRSHRLIHSETKKIAALLQDAGIKTLVLDEAHHLRSEWWKSLSILKESLDGVKMVSLTATPPYDVPYQEWERYKSMCGPVDTEVPVPELVSHGDLCPHQDYIFINTPSHDEHQRIKGFRQEVERILTGIYQSHALVNMLLSHPYIITPDQHMEEILDNPAFFSSLLIYLNHVRKDVPSGLIKIMGHEKKRLPAFDLEWAEIFLTGLLFRHAENFEAFEALLKPFRQDLSRIGAVERREVSLRHTDKIKKMLLTSINKLSSVQEIVRLESEALGAALRMVILTDYIRKADLPSGPQDIKPLIRLGVVPIFEAIRRQSLRNVRLGILSGTLVILPKDCEEKMRAYAAERSVPSHLVRFTVLPHAPNFLGVEIGDQTREPMVHLVTRLFNDGQVTVLVGTKSLLGEGWDAPTINSLVLASFVGSYVLSNQMRGRAIRSLPGHPEKTANVWHPVCVEEEAKDPGGDYEMLCRRFKAFVGVSCIDSVIENGIDRLGLGSPPFDRPRIIQINQQMTLRALDRDGLRNKWEEALKKGEEGVRMVEEIRVHKAHLPRNFVFRNTISALFWEGVFLGGFIFSHIMEATPRGRHNWTFKQFMIFLGIAFGIAVVVALPKCLKAIWLFLKHGRIESSMRQVGEALLKTLCFSGFIKTGISKLKVRADQDPSGCVLCSLEGGTSFDKFLFLDTFQETLEPIENPRYILAREGIWGWFSQKDYHAVPQILGKSKRTAEYFEKMWRKYVGTVKLHYTRTLEGRQLLLRARTNSVSYAFQKRAERLNRWK